MRNKLSEWASIAEIVSGFAVVVTLVLLILGIRENSELTRLSIYSDLLDSLNRWQENSIRDTDLAALVSAFVTNGDLSEFDAAQQTRLIQHIQNLFRIYETAWYSRSFDVVDSGGWARFERTICLNYDRVTLNNLPISPVLNEEFGN